MLVIKICNFKNPNLTMFTCNLHIFEANLLNNENKQINGIIHSEYK